MGSTLLTINANQFGTPGPGMQLADRLLDQLYLETKRLMQEKDYAVHAVANALVQRGELIGVELDEVFQYADESHPEKAGKFVRKLVELPKVHDWKNENDTVAISALAAAAGVPVPTPPGTPQPPPASRRNF